MARDGQAEAVEPPQLRRERAVGRVLGQAALLGERQQAAHVEVAEQRRLVRQRVHRVLVAVRVGQARRPGHRRGAGSRPDRSRSRASSRAWRRRSGPRARAAAPAPRSRRTCAWSKFGAPSSGSKARAIGPCSLARASSATLLVDVVGEELQVRGRGPGRRHRVATGLGGLARNHGQRRLAAKRLQEIALQVHVGGAAEALDQVREAGRDARRPHGRLAEQRGSRIAGLADSQVGEGVLGQRLRQLRLKTRRTPRRTRARPRCAPGRGRCAPPARSPSSAALSANPDATRSP